MLLRAHCHGDVSEVIYEIFIKLIINHKAVSIMLVLFNPLYTIRPSGLIQ